MEIVPVPPRMIMYDRAQLPLVSTGVACSDLRIDVDSIQSDISEINGYLWKLMNKPYMNYFTVIGISTQKIRERCYERTEMENKVAKQQDKKKGYKTNKRYN